MPLRLKTDVQIDCRTIFLTIALARRPGHSSQPPRISSVLTPQHHHQPSIEVPYGLLHRLHTRRVIAAQEWGCANPSPQYSLLYLGAEFELQYLGTTDVPYVVWAASSRGCMACAASSWAMVKLACVGVWLSSLRARLEVAAALRSHSGLRYL